MAGSSTDFDSSDVLCFSHLPWDFVFQPAAPDGSLGAAAARLLRRGAGPSNRTSRDPARPRSSAAFARVRGRVKMHAARRHSVTAGLTTPSRFARTWRSRLVGLLCGGAGLPQGSTRLGARSEGKDLAGRAAPVWLTCILQGSTIRVAAPPTFGVQSNRRGTRYVESVSSQPSLVGRRIKAPIAKQLPQAALNS